MSSSLVSVFQRPDPLPIAHQTFIHRVIQVVDSQNLYNAALPAGRRRFEIPTCYEAELSPQVNAVASLAGMPVGKMLAELSSCETHVTAIGFGPGQLYLAEFPDAFDIPRQSGLSASVPVGKSVDPAT